MSLALLTACSDSTSTGTTPSDPASVAGTTYSGVLDDGSIVSLTFASTASALVADRAATSTTFNVTGTLTTATGTTYTINGTYNSSTGAFHVTAGPYTLDGTYGAGSFKGAYTGPGGSSGALAAGNATSVTRYCGRYSGSGEDGAFMVLVAGQKAFLTVNGIAAEGTVTTVNGTTTVTFSIAATTGHPKLDITGTVSGASVSGHWTATDSSGTGTGDWSGSSETCGGSSSNTTNPQCNAISGTWTVGATTGETPSNATCNTVLAAAGGHLGQAATVTVATSGNSVTVNANGDILTGTLNPTTCKLSLSMPISDSVTVGGTSVTITGTQTNDITFNSNSSLTNAWNVTISSATGISGLPCSVSATQTGSK